MSVKNFLWERIPAIVFNIGGMMSAAIFVWVVAGAAEAAIVAAAWTGAFAVYLTVSFILQRKKLNDIRRIVRTAQDKYLLSEIVPEPNSDTDRLYYEIMLLQGKAAVENVCAAERERVDYYDYLQNWAHEIKTPVAAINLICAGRNGEEYKNILRQLGKINNYVEQILYEAKSKNVEKDILIKKTDICSVINECVKESKQMFIDSGMSIEVDAQGCALTDGKWLEFILKQILINSVQYSCGDPKVKIETVNLPGGKLMLSVTDNGIGILKSELPRVFDKGFTGSNGRQNKKSTGLGLYICKKLCDALEITLTAESAANEYTRISLVFNSSFDL